MANYGLGEGSLPENFTSGYKAYSPQKYNRMSTTSFIDSIKKKPEPVHTQEPAQNNLIGIDPIDVNATIPSAQNTGMYYGTLTDGTGNSPSMFAPGGISGATMDNINYGNVSGSGLGLVGMLDNIGGAKGAADIANASASIYGMYNDYQQNKRADKVLDMQTADRNNQYAANDTWNINMAASGLGTANRPVLR